MSATRNDITGDVISSKVRGAEDMSAYQSGWDRIFGKTRDDHGNVMPFLSEDDPRRGDFGAIAIDARPELRIVCSNDDACGTYRCVVEFGSERICHVADKHRYESYAAFVAAMNRLVTVERIDEWIAQRNAGHVPSLFGERND